MGSMGQAASSAVSLYAQYHQMKHAEDVGEYNAAVDTSNAKKAEFEAQYQRKRTDLELSTHRRRVGQVKGAQVARIAASGVTMEGSAVDALADTEYQAEIDAQLIEMEGTMAEERARGKADQYRQKAKITTLDAKNRKLSSRLGMARTLLQTGNEMWERR